MRHFTTLILCVVLFAATLSAQDAPENKIPTGMKQLQLFHGNWEGPGSYEGNGSTMDFTMKCTGTPILNGTAVELNPTADLKDMGTYMEKDFVAWDPMLKQVTMFSVSNMGEVGQYNGNWVKGKTNTLELKGSKIVDNDTYKFNVTIFFHDGNQMTWRAVSTKNDLAEGTFEVTMTRK